MPIRPQPELPGRKCGDRGVSRPSRSDGTQYGSIFFLSNVLKVSVLVTGDLFVAAPPLAVASCDGANLTVCFQSSTSNLDQNMLKIRNCQSATTYAQGSKKICASLNIQACMNAAVTMAVILRCSLFVANRDLKFLSNYNVFYKHGEIPCKYSLIDVVCVYCTCTWTQI